jgi:hypothetical protein
MPVVATNRKHWGGLAADFVWCRLELRSRKTAYFPWLDCPRRYARASARLCSLRSWNSKTAWHATAFKHTSQAFTAPPASTMRQATLAAERSPPGWSSMAMRSRWCSACLDTPSLITPTRTCSPPWRHWKRCLPRRFDTVRWCSMSFT